MIAIEHGVAAGGTLSAAGQTYRGTAGADIFFGTADDDILYGRDGNDRLSGAAGRDELYGGDGNDYLGIQYTLGDPRDYPYVAYLSDIDTFADLLSGGAGDDAIFAGWGDTVYGGSGTDTVSFDFLLATEAIIADFNILTSGGSFTFGGAVVNGIEYIQSGSFSAFDDRIVVGAVRPGAYTLVFGNGGNDTLIGQASPDSLSGGTGNDVVRGGDGNDGLLGDSGEDILDGDAGNDRLVGGDGDDDVRGGDGNDTLLGMAGRDQLYGGAGNDTLAMPYGEVYSDRFGYYDYYTVYDVDTVPDLLSGGDGDDVIYGTWGDEIDGGDGFDIVHFNFDNAPEAIVANFAKLTAGNEIFIGEARVRGIEQIARDPDNPNSQYGMQLSRFDDRVRAGVVTAEGYDSGIDGGEGDDVIVASSNATRLVGGAGSDRLIGGDGDDTLSADGGDDVAVGGGGNDSVYGYDGADRLFGGLGNDDVDGGSGDDTLFGDVGNDELAGANGNDRIDGGVGADMLFGGTGNDVLRGGSGADRLDGQTGVDRLDGGEGDDVLTVGAFADGETLIGGAGADRFVIAVEPVTRYSPAMPVLRILDFSRSEGDVIDVSGATGTFAFIGTDAFHRTPNEVRYSVTNGQTLIQFDADGNGQADLTIRLTQEIALVATDFAL